VDLPERERRSAQAVGLVDALGGRGVVGVAATFVDNSGITRVKTVPLHRLPSLASWGVGSSSSFDLFRFDDHIAGAGLGVEPVGDLRVIADLSRAVPPVE